MILIRHIAINGRLRKVSIAKWIDGRCAAARKDAIRMGLSAGAMIKAREVLPSQ
jgi:hypothetical protein